VSFLNSQQVIHITPQSGFYKNQAFKSEILKVSQNSFLTKTPYYQGKIVLLPVGTLVKIDIPNKQTFYSEIVSKNLKGSQTCVELLMPYQIMKKKKIRAPKIITVTSGKGGVGKTTLLLNMAMILGQKGLRVCIVDADLGTANIDVLLNLNAQYTLKDIVEGRKNIFGVLLEGPYNSVIIPGTSGFQALTNISQAEVQKIINRFALLEPYIDIILIDTCPGVSNNTMYFNQYADQIILVTTSEPHAITDAYATLKVLVDKKIIPNVSLVINKVEKKAEAEEISERIVSAAKKFLSLNISGLGFIYEDCHVAKSVKRLFPCVIKYPECKATSCYKIISNKLYASYKESFNNLPLFERLKHMIP
jgi:flagellar biosynthesis protein FlhG